MTEVIKKTGIFESFDQTPIYYEVRGEGPPLFLLYGIACSIHHWRHQIRYFSKNYQTIVMDYRGHQGTGLPEKSKNLSINALVEDIHTLLKHLNLKKCSFWGHSFGSQVILAAYKKYPQMFHNIVLINGFAASPLSRTFGHKYAIQAVAAIKYGYKKAPLALSRLWRLAVIHPFTLRMSALTGGFNLQLSSFRDIEVYSRGVASINLEVFTQFFQEMVTYDAREILPAIQVPTLIIGGSKDSITPISIQKDLAKTIPDCEFLSVPFGSHSTTLDMPELVNLRIEKFLERKKWV